MRVANELHDEVLRGCLTKYRGDEISTSGDAFHLAVHTILDAAEYCVAVQLRLLSAEWPKELHDVLPATKRERGKGKGFFYNGLHVRMGIHDAREVEGVLVTDTHPVTGKVTYTGLTEMVANEVGEVGAGGEICVTHRVARWLQQNSASLSFKCAVERVGQHRIDVLDMNIDVHRVIPSELVARRPTYEQHCTSRSSGCSLAIEQSHLESSQVWSSGSVDAVESAYSVSS